MGKPKRYPVERSRMFTSEGYHAREDFHFTTQATRSAYQDAALSTGSISIFGVFLHAFQDAYSHSGSGPETGHIKRWHAPDKPAGDRQKFMRMAERSQEAIAQFASLSGLVEASPVPFEVIKSDVKAWAETSDQSKRLMLEYRMRMTIADYRRQEGEKKAAEQAVAETTPPSSN